MTKQIQLTHGQVAIVCDCHYYLVAPYKWQAQWHSTSHQFRAVRVQSLPNGGQKSVKMHAVINATPQGMATDHIDRNMLNNCCSNLRTATKSQNGANGFKYKCNKSGFKGVFYCSKNTWRAQIRVNNKSIHLGCYKDRELAARAYDVAAIEHFGEFARLNFPI